MKLSNEHLATLLDNVSEAIVVADQAFRIVYFNRAAEQVFGYNVEEILGRSLDQLLPEPLAEIHRQHIREFMTTPSTTRMMEKRPGLVARNKDGVEFPVEIGISKIVQDGEEFYAAIVVDITERKQAEDASRESEEKFRLIAERITEVFYLVDIRNNKTLYVSPGFEQVWGESRSEVEQSPQNFMKAIHPDDLGRVKQGLVVQQSGLPFDLEYRIIRPDGEMRWIWDRGYPVRSADGTVDRYVGVAQDITERKRADEALRKSEAQLSNAMKIANLGPWELDVASGVFSFTDTFYALFRTNAKEMGGDQMRIADYAKRFVHPEDASRISAAIPKGAEADVPNSYGGYLEHRMFYADGSAGHMAVRYFFVRDDKGTIIKTYGVNQDITERKRALEALRASEEKFHALIEHSSDAIALVDAQGIVLFESPAAEQMLGYSNQEFLDRSVLKWIHPDDLEHARQAFIQLASEPGSTRTTECRLQHKDGTWRWVEVVGTNLLNIPTVHAIVLNHHDITERKQAEAKIQEQLERLTALREVDRVIASTFDVHMGLNMLLSHTQRLLAVDAVAVLLLNPVQNVLTYTAGIGFHTNAIHNSSVRLGTSQAGKVALERRMVETRIGSNEPEDQLLTDHMRGENFVSYHGAPVIAKGKVIGVLEVYSRSFVDRDRDWLDFFSTLAQQAAILIDSAKLFNDLQTSNVELSLAYDATIEGWSRALDLRDKETEGHTQRVTKLTMQLAQQMGIPDDELIHFRRGALLHDIGKLGVPDRILQKADVLTEPEWGIMKKHPIFAYELLSPIRYLDSASIDIPYYHHEKWDGTGYPRGLKGEQIPLSARIFAVVDVWDALCSDRPYRPAWPEDKVREHIKSLGGIHLDPRVVQVFLSLV